MAAPKPKVVGLVSEKREPKPLDEVSREERWSFSFQYWRQIENFAFSGLDCSWLVSFLEGIRSTEEHLGTLIEGNTALRSHFHFHDVIWDRAKVEIKRHHLTWLPKEILENDVEFPMHQLGLGKGPLRVVGFWYPKSQRFNVVLVDPHHNIHKTEKYSYGVYCSPVLSRHDGFLAQLQNIIDTVKCAAEEACEFRARLAHLDGVHHQQGQIFVDADYLELAIDLVREGKVKSCAEILKLGVEYCMMKG